MSLVYVFVGGGVGSICRFLLGDMFKSVTGQFPTGTFVANILSCLILGALIGYQVKHELSSMYTLLLMTGFCGGFSTFSTFSGELMLNLQAGHVALVFWYLLASVVMGVLSLSLGYFLLAGR